MITAAEALRLRKLKWQKEETLRKEEALRREEEKRQRQAGRSVGNLLSTWRRSLEVIYDNSESYIQYIAWMNVTFIARGDSAFVTFPPKQPNLEKRAGQIYHAVGSVFVV